MASNVGNIAATASLNIDPFQSSSRVLAAQMRSIDGALKTMETSFKNNSKNINAQKAQYQLTGKAVQNYTDQLELQKKKYEDLKVATGDINKATVQQKTDLLSAEAAVNKTASQIESLTGKYNALGKQIAISESNWTKSGKVLEDFGNKTSKIGEGLNSFGNKMTLGVTAPIVAGVTAVTKAAMDWETAFAGTKKTVDEVVDANGRVVYSYADLEAGLRGLARELPSTHQEIAATAEAAGQLGIQTEKVVSFTETMIGMGVSTTMSAEDAATAMARFANITNMSQDDFERLGSVIVDLGNNMATTESEITAMSLRLAGAGSQIGMTEAEIVSFAAALSSVGIEAEAGGSAFSKVMIQMQLATEKGMGAFDELISLGEQSGVSFERINKAVQDGGKNLKSVASEMGLTSKQLSSMYKEADKSATSLQNFAEVAGMTNAQFGNLFKENPSEAIMKFVEGLSKAEEQGTSAIKVLDDMDITEVRLRDSLLRAANASGVFGDAIKRGNTAWSENTALAEEVAKRYKTVESQLDTLKGNINDVAITLGGPFLAALNSGIQSARPFIDTIAKLATKFSEANPETQQAIMKYIGLAAAIGPASKVLGGFLKIAGGGISGIGKLAQGIGKLSGTARASKTALDLASVGATGLGASSTLAVGTGATGLAGLGTSLAALAGPAAIGVLAIGAVTGAVYLGKKAYDEHQLAGAKWGTEVTKAQDEVIEKSYQLQEEAVANINAYGDGVAGAAEKAIESNQKIVDSIQSVLDKEIERKREAAKGIEDPKSQEKANKSIDYDEKVNAQIVKNAQDRVNKINTIVSNASQNSRQISDAERQYIANNYSQLSKQQLEAANFNQGEILAIQSAYQDKLSKLSYKQLEDRANTVSIALNEEQKKHEEQLSIFKELYGEGTTAYKAEVEKQEASHRQSTENMILGLAKLRVEQGHSIESMAAVWEQYGWTVEEVTDLVNGSILDTTRHADMFAKGTHEADIAWNEMVFDPKTGEIKTNMADTLLEIAQSENGWDQLHFIAKNADLNSNAKEEIAVAMGEAGKWLNLSIEEKMLLIDGDEAKLRLYDIMGYAESWQNLTFEEKMLLMDGNEAQVAIYDALSELNLWDKYNADRKELGIDNTDVVWKLLDTEEKLIAWNQLEPKDKNLLAQNTEFITAITSSEEIMNAWNQLEPNEKELVANNDGLLQLVTTSEEALNQYKELDPGIKQLLADDSASMTYEEASAFLASYNAMSPELKTLLANGPASMTIEEARTALDNYNKLPPDQKVLLGRNEDAVKKVNDAYSKLGIYNELKVGVKHLNATDGASGPANNATAAVDNFNQRRDHTVTLTTRFVTINETIYQEGKAGGPRAIRATGDPYFQGGPVWLGDGGKQEPYLTPQGDFGISPADWTLYDLPRGTKIWPSISKMMESLPQYANGTKFDDTVMSRFKFNGSQQMNVDSSKWDVVIALLNRLVAKENNFAFEGSVVLENGREIGRWLNPEIRKINQNNDTLNKIMEGKRV